MSKFNVVRVYGGWCGMQVGDLATVTQVGPNNSGVKLKEFPGPHHSNNTLTLAYDVLPTAPTDVKYNEGVDLLTLRVTSLEANPHYPARIRVGILGKDGQGCTVLSPDDALQLCHDLRRMAMDIKRKEKNG